MFIIVEYKTFTMIIKRNFMVLHVNVNIPQNCCAPPSFPFLSKSLSRNRSLLEAVSQAVLLYKVLLKRDEGMFTEIWTERRRVSEVIKRHFYNDPYLGHELLNAKSRKHSSILLEKQVLNAQFFNLKDKLTNDVFLFSFLLK